MASAELSLPPVVPSQTLVLVPLVIALCIVFIAAVSLLTLHFLITKLYSDPPLTITSESKKYLCDSIPIRLYVRDPSGSQVDSHDCCSVCLGAFEEGDSVRDLPSCQHTFHVPCIDAWLTSHANCPLCRREVEAVTTPEFVAVSMEAMGGGDMVRDAESGGDAPIVRSGSSVWPSSGSGVLLSVGEKLRLTRFSSMNCFDVSCDVEQGSVSSTEI